MRWIRPEKLKFKPRSPFRTSDDFGELTLWWRLDKRMAAGMPCAVIIIGPGQSGKTTCGKFICQHYRQQYALWYSVKDMFATMHEYERRYEAGDWGFRWNWHLFDEPQGEAPAKKWADERLMAIETVFSMYGELKPNVVMCLPDLSDLTKRMYRNVALIISMYAKNVGGVIEHKATCYRPDKPIWRDKWKMKDVGQFVVPYTPRTTEELIKKMDNLFKDKLVRAEDAVRLQEQAEQRKLYVKPEDPYSPSWLHK